MSHCVTLLPEYPQNVKAQQAICFCVCCFVGILFFRLMCCYLLDLFNNKKFKKIMTCWCCLVGLFELVELLN